MFEMLPKINFDEARHILTREDGRILLSTNRFIERFEPPFEREAISYMMARKELRQIIGWKKKGDPEPLEEAIKGKQAEILKQWDELRDDAAEHGHGIHKILEQAIIERTSENIYVQALLHEYSYYYDKMYSEVRLSHPEFDLGGITDFTGIRKGKELVIDVEDFKSNKRKGIAFMSGKMDEKGQFKFYNKFFLDPIAHLEHCGYIRNCLQLSIYAFCLESSIPGSRIGRLAIRFVEVDEEGDIMSINYHPIPYMKDTVVKMIMETIAKESSIVF